MKGLAESLPFHLLTNPHVINRFIVGHGVVIYYYPSIFRRFSILKIWSVIYRWIQNEMFYLLMVLLTQ